MELYTNQLDFVPTAEHKAAAETALALLEDALHFTVDVPHENQKRLFKLGERSEEFVQQAHEAASTRVECMPKGLNMPEFERAMAAREHLVALEERLLPLMKKLRDTRMLAGADVMQWCMLVNRALSAHGKAAGYGSLRKKLGQRVVSPGANRGESDAGGAPAAV